MATMYVLEILIGIVVGIATARAFKNRPTSTLWSAGTGIAGGFMGAWLTQSTLALSTCCPTSACCPFGACCVPAYIGTALGAWALTALLGYVTPRIRPT